MGNTPAKRLQSDNKKTNSYFFPVVSPLFLKYQNQFRYVDLQSVKVSGQGCETRNRNMDVTNSQNNRATMNAANQMPDQTRRRDGNVPEDRRSLGEKSAISINASNSKKSNLKVSNEELSFHSQDEHTTGSVNIETNCAASLNTQDQVTTSMVSFSSLWLPFRSPFRRTVFSSDNMVATQSNLNGLLDDSHQKLPMAAPSRFDTPVHIGSQNSQFSPWAHQYTLNTQPSESNPMVITSLNQGDVPIRATNNSGESFFTGNKDLRTSNGNVVDEKIDKCCTGFVPPLFQTSAENVPESISGRQATNERKKITDSSSFKKQGLLQIRMNRRGRNDTKGTKEPRNHEVQRLNSKKQRAAHQASSPSSSALLNRNGSLNRNSNRGRDASPPPSVRIINGFKVTMIDEELKVFVVDLLTPETCDLVRCMTNEHVKKVHESGNKVATWRTLYTYTKRDLPCSEVKGLTSRVTDHIMASIIDVVGAIFDKKEEAAKLHPRSWKEPHLLSYVKLENQTPHTGVEMHYDGCDITWNCMLSKSSEYDGGGTYIRALRKTVRLEQGQVLVHPGELYHKGCDITRGKRDLIVCFMDGFDPQIVDSSSAQEDNVIYEKNVRSY